MPVRSLHCGLRIRGGQRGTKRLAARRPQRAPLPSCRRRRTRRLLICVSRLGALRSQARHFIVPRAYLLLAVVMASQGVALLKSAEAKATSLINAAREGARASSARARLRAAPRLSRRSPHPRPHHLAQTARHSFARRRRTRAAKSTSTARRVRQSCALFSQRRPRSKQRLRA